MSRDVVDRMEILLVKDNLEDANATIQALKCGYVQCRVTLVCDGEEAISFLHQKGGRACSAFHSLTDTTQNTNHFRYQESDEMTMIELFKPHAVGVMQIVGAVRFHHIPLTTVADLYCNPSGVLSFERAVEVSGHLAMSEVVGTVDGYEWHRR